MEWEVVEQANLGAKAGFRTRESWRQRGVPLIFGTSNPGLRLASQLLEQLQEILGDTYRVDRELGGAGMSRVFLAHEVELERQVVVKVLPPDLAAGINADRFRREIQLAARLQHPHIVPLLSAGAKGGLHDKLDRGLKTFSGDKRR